MTALVFSLWWKKKNATMGREGAVFPIPVITELTLPEAEDLILWYIENHVKPGVW